MDCPTIALMHETFKDSFMKPQAFFGADIESEVLEAGLDLEFDGIYCRLSAPGYLDRTDWHGPFESLSEAADHLLDMYA